MKIIKLPNSEIIEIGSGKPVVAVVGLLHGDELCGRKVLDELKSKNLDIHGTLKLIYANLKAEEKDVRGIEGNLNRVFPGNPDGNVEEKTAFELSSYLKDCDFVLDIHSTSYPTEPFVISTEDSKEFDKLASFTGLRKYVIMVDKMANGKSLIDEVNHSGGKGISFESGTHKDISSIETAKKATYNFLKNLGIIKGKKEISHPEKFFGKSLVAVPSKEFKAYPNIKNFELLKAGTPYGKDEKKEYSLDYDCYPFLFSDQLIDGLVFLVAQKS